MLYHVLSSLPAGLRPVVALNGRGEVAQALAGEGIPVLYLPIGNYSSGRKTTWDRVRFALRTLWCSLILVNITFRHKIQALYANGPRTFFCAVIAAFITRRPLVWHLHNVLSDGIELRLVVCFSRGVERILACSKAAASPLLLRAPSLAKKTKVVYSPAPRWEHTFTREQALAGFGHPAERGIVTAFGIVGRITPFKGQREFVEAASLVVQHLPAVFWVVGSPAAAESQDRIYFDQIRDQVKQAGLQSSVFFLPHQQRMELCYALLDVVVLATQGQEGLGLTALEAMSLGKAIIAPAAGGVLEMLDDGETALLAPKATAAELAERMLRLLQNPELRSQLGRNALRNALERFSQERFDEEIGRVIKELGGQHGGLCSDT